MRTLSAKNVYSIVARTMPFTGIWEEVFDHPEYGGAWIIYGPEKNGKTSFALMLANYLSTLEKVLYISAEEGMQDSFKRAMFRAGISPENRTLKFSDYLPGEPYTATAKACRRYAKIIVRIQGLAAFVSGRVNGRGGRIVIDEEKAALRFGDEINNTTNNQ